MGGPKSDTPPDEPLWEVPDPTEEPTPEPPPEESPWEMPDPVAEPSYKEELMPEKWEVEPEPVPEIPAEPVEAAAVVIPTETPEMEPAPQPEAEAIIPIEPEKAPKLPSWIVEAEAEAKAAVAPTEPAEPIPAADLKAAPVIDWTETVSKTAEALAVKAAPLSALPEAEKPMEPPSPVEHPPESEPLPLVEAPEEDTEEQVMERITGTRRLKLMARIDDLLDDIYNRLSAETGQNTLEEVLKLLKTARHTLIENPRDYDTAEYYTFRAKMLIDRFQSVRRDSYRWTGLALFAYEVALLMIVIVGFVYGKPLTDALIGQGVPDWAVAPWTTMMASAGGAILGALWALVEHTAIKQDFNKQHAMWFLGSPVTGLLLGVVIYFMMHAGTLAMGVSVPAGEGGAPLDPDWFLLTLAALIGFQQNVALDLFERFIKLIRPAKAA